MNWVEIEDVSNREDLHLVMVQQVQTRRQRGEETLSGQPSQLDLNPAPRNLILEQSKLGDREPIGQPKLDTRGEKQAPTPIVVIPPEQVEPVGNSPSSQPVPMVPILVSTPIRINPVENKEYSPFTTILKENVNLSSENHIGVSQEPLLGGPTNVE